MDRSGFPFDQGEAEAFRSYVLAGCKRLEVEALRQLADDIHECARIRRARPCGRDVEPERPAADAATQLSLWAG